MDKVYKVTFPPGTIYRGRKTRVTTKRGVTILLKSLLDSPRYKDVLNTVKVEEADVTWNDVSAEVVDRIRRIP